MINGVELEIVKMFVAKSKQERIIWEFGKPEKRQNIMLRRFAGPEIFDGNCIQLVEYMPPQTLKNCLSHLSNAKEVYYIGEDYIGKLSLDQAALRANTGEICIIYCGNGIGYYQGEECGRPPRYLLRTNTGDGSLS